MFGIVVARRGEKMKISDLYSDVVSEDLKYGEFFLLAFQMMGRPLA